jgi:cyclohexanone monooxygenase
VVGRGGVTLTEKWADGVATLHGMHSRAFPNCFIMSNTQSGFTVNYPHMLNEQAKHIGYILQTCAERGVTVVEASQAAEDEWVETIVSSALQRAKFAEECTPGYYNNEGQPSALAARNGPYGKGPIAFVKILEDWRENGTLAGLETTSR